MRFPRRLPRFGVGTPAIRSALAGAATLIVLTATPLHAQQRANRSVAPGTRADLPRDLRQVRLVTRPQESAKRERPSRRGRHGSPFGGQHHALGLFAPTILVGVRVDVSGEQPDQRRAEAPESKVIDVAAVLRSQSVQTHTAPTAAANDSAYVVGPAAGIERVAWLQGCWESSSQQRTVEERWTAPRAGGMLGTSRTTRGGTLVEHEFITLREVDGGLAYQAQPSGQPAAEFHSTTITDSTVVFENPRHDFPQLIGYRRGVDSLHAWIEGPGRSGLRRVNFAYRRVACEP